MYGFLVKIRLPLTALSALWVWGQPGALSLLPVQAAPILPAAPPPATTQELKDPLNRALFPPDDLVPSHIPLSVFQRRRLSADLDRLHQEGLVLSQGGQLDSAFVLWYRELRGRQALGNLAEIKALGNVGAIAWENNRREDVGIITRRLEAIQGQEEKSHRLTPELLTALAQAHQQMRNLDEVIKLYQNIRQRAQQEKNYRQENEALTFLGDLYLAKFDYPQAGQIYEILLERARLSKNIYYEGIYLQKLAEIYSKSAQPAQGVRIKEDLARRYVQSQKVQLLPNLKLAIADDYVSLRELEKARQNYQEAYSLGWSLQQYGAAGLALSKLADLYQAQGQGNDALQIYQRLLKVEQQSYNYYGLMQTYEKIAQLYLNARQYKPALTAYQQSLSLARALKYTAQEAHLLNQIEQVSQQQQQSP